MSTHGAVQQQSELSEIQMLRKAARGFLAEEWPVEHAVENCGKADLMRELYVKAAAQGWTLIGGEDRDSVETLVVLSEEVGRASAALSLGDAYLANIILRSAISNDAVRNVFEDLQQGTRLISVALASLDGDPNAGEVELTGRDRNRLSGKVRFVEDLAIADHLLVVTAGGQVALVATASEGVKTTLTPGLGVPAFGDVEFSNTPAVVFPVPHALLVEASAIARLASTARAFGAADRAVELAIENAKVRVQFEQPIGKFQAVQHRLASCSIWLTATRGLIDEAIEAYLAKKPDWEARADAARTFACKNLRQTVAEAQYALGGLGFMEEHEAPRLFLRVQAEMLRYGGVSAARNSLANYLLTDGSTSRSLPTHNFGESAEAFRQEFRTWLAANYPEEKRRQRWNTLPRHEQIFDKEYSKALARDGYLGISWPKEAGGRGLGLLEEYVFAEESDLNDLPQWGHFLAVGIVGPSLMQFGTPEQLKEYVPKILQGDLSLCLGYSEPEAGSDLAALRTKAVKDGDDWIVNGAKIHQSNGEHADYTWLAVRTDPDLPKHKGISIFLVPLNLPGITIQPHSTMHGHTACAVFYDNVRVPSNCLIGKLNEGWKIIGTALAHERLMSGTTISKVFKPFESFLNFLVNTVRDGKPLARDPIVRQKVSAISAELMAAQVLSVNVLNTVQAGKVPIAEAAMAKCFAGETEELCANEVLDILGTVGTLNAHAAGNAIDGRFAYFVADGIMTVITAGTNDIQRNIIAQVGLGLPR
jgi:3-oxo-4-pregnene-20-carboxyl-CoA dehydrogenase beta subunit